MRWYREQCSLCHFPDGLASPKHAPDCMFWTPVDLPERPTENGFFHIPLDDKGSMWSIYGVTWLPMRCLPPGEISHARVVPEAPGVLLVGGTAYYDEGLWVQPGPFMTPVRRSSFLDDLICRDVG